MDESKIYEMEKAILKIENEISELVDENRIHEVEKSMLKIENRISELVDENRIHEVEKSMLKIENRISELKVGIIEQLKFSLDNLHSHVKEQGSSTRKILDCVKDDIADLRINVVTKTELKEKLNKYVEVDKCKLNHTEIEKQFITKQELIKITGWLIGGIGIVFAIVKFFLPLVLKTI